MFYNRCTRVICRSWRRKSSPVLQGPSFELCSERPFVRSGPLRCNDECVHKVTHHTLYSIALYLHAWLLLSVVYKVIYRLKQYEVYRISMITLRTSATATTTTTTATVLNVRYN